MRRRRKTTNIRDFKKTNFIDKKLIDKVSLWMLRIILNLDGHQKLIDESGFVSNDNIVLFLDGSHFLEEDNDFTKVDILEFFKKKSHALEKQKHFTTNKILAKNIAQISSLMKLNTYEEQVLEFVVLLNQYDLLDEAADLLGSVLNTTQVKKVLSVILDIPKKEIEAIFASDSKLGRSSLVTISKSNLHSLDRKLDSLNDTFLDNLLNLDEDITVMLKDSIRSCEKSSLKLKDYKHISDDLDILVPYLKNSLKTKQNGVNILLYGLPGTGKTELVKVLAQKLKTKLFEVSYIDANDESIDGKNRLKAYKSAQALLSSKKTILMYDESEDIFQRSSGGFFSPPTRQKDKAWINKVLETNAIPTIWITNNIHSIDNALVRRFDMSIEMPIPKKSKREKIIRKYSDNLLDKKTIKLLAEHKNIAPALISSTAKVINLVDLKDKSKAFRHILNNTLKAQGYKEINKEVLKESTKPTLYNPNYVNTTIDLKQLTAGIKKTKNARLCLYGIPGTGKSAFGQYVAKVLKKPLLLKKGSDLISKWVGGTEQNIARAFSEAKEQKAILVFDEVDSFLADRTQAKQSWEVTQVNEMLVQMENFDGVFIATTNLMDNLDKASIRRFDIKLEFKSLEKNQAYGMFKEFAKDLRLSKITTKVKEKIFTLRQLTPGDFATVVRQNRFNPIKDCEDFISRLQDEVDMKNIDNDIKVGFIK